MSHSFLAGTRIKDLIWDELGTVVSGPLPNSPAYGFKPGGENALVRWDFWADGPAFSSRIDLMVEAVKDERKED